MIRALPLIAVLIGVPATGTGQTPGLDGTVAVSVKRGTLEAELCIRDAFVPGDSAHFLLNAGLTISRAEDGAGRQLAITTSDSLRGAAVLHALQLPPDGSVLCVEYAGAFPVYRVDREEYRQDDGSAVIAFNGRTLRARGETRWHPVPYDARMDRALEAMSYRLLVQCRDCDQLYVNGAGAALGPIAEFVSEEPHELLLFVGDYPAQRHDGVTFLGEAVHPDTARAFLRIVSEVQDFYAEFTGTPFGEPLDILRIVPVRLDRIGQFWGFFADPALGLIGLPIPLFVQIVGDTAEAGRPLVLGAVAHELAHRYFPGTRFAGSRYMQLFSEPFAVYLDLKATRHFHGRDAYDARVDALIDRVEAGPELPPLEEAQPIDVARDEYRYAYAPALLLTLEQHIGDQGMRRLLHALLAASPADQAAADYQLLRRSARSSGVSADTWREWATRCSVGSAANPCLQELRRSASTN